MDNKIEKAEKNEAIEGMLERLSGIIGSPRSVAFEQGICVLCGGEAKEFNDSVSEREYALSGMCQCCQDKMFI